MKIFLNGQETNISSKTCLDELILEKNKIIIINGKIYRYDEIRGKTLKENDSIDILDVITGG